MGGGGAIVPSGCTNVGISDIFQTWFNKYATNRSKSLSNL
jgi:hypothetical protein